MNDSSPLAQKKRRRHGRSLLIILLVLVSLAGIGASIFFYSKYQTATKDESDARQQTAVVQSLRETIELPQEDPAIVTVTDKSKLTNKVLAERVQNQDTLFIFEQAKRLIIYRSESGKVIDMLTFNSQADLPSRSHSDKTSDTPQP